MIPLYIEELENVGGGGLKIDVLPGRGCPPIKPPITLALRENPCDPIFTTLAIGEENGGGPIGLPVDL